MANPTLDHIVRYDVPWRDEPRTECGRDVSDVASCLTKEQAIAKWKREGQQRAAYTTCMTCLGRANVSRPWEDDPGAILAREYNGVWGARSPERVAEEARRKTELLALGQLVVAHLAEFREVIAGLEQVSSLDAHRRSRRAMGKPI